MTSSDISSLLHGLSALQRHNEAIYSNEGLALGSNFGSHGVYQNGELTLALTNKDDDISVKEDKIIRGGCLTNTVRCVISLSGG
eukprot:9496365-Pyramimonas_sp.AAC.1